MGTGHQLDRLRELVDTGRVVDERTFAGLDADAALDRRDSDPFDSAWLRIFDLIGDRSAAIGPSERSSIDELRERVFMRVYELTANSDLAAFASDDFEIIAGGSVLDLADPWLNALWASYADRRFPMGELRPIAGELRELVRRSK